MRGEGIAKERLSVGTSEDGGQKAENQQAAGNGKEGQLGRLSFAGWRLRSTPEYNPRPWFRKRDISRRCCTLWTCDDRFASTNCWDSSSSTSRATRVPWLGAHALRGRRRDVPPGRARLRPNEARPAHGHVHSRPACVPRAPAS